MDGCVNGTMILCMARLVPVSSEIQLTDFVTSNAGVIKLIKKQIEKVRNEMGRRVKVSRCLDVICREKH